MNKIIIKNYDAIIIGAGQAGPALAHRLSLQGMNVAIIERKWFGGTCVNTGCIPTKTLIASAHIAELIRRSNDFGISIKNPIEIDMKKIKARKDKIVLKYREGLKTWLTDTPHCDVYEGHASFIDNHTVQLENVGLLQADKFFINVGARASAPPLPGVEKIKPLDNATILNIDFVPQHLIVVGGSYVGLEFAQMFRRFGSDVTVIEKADRLIPREDPDISDTIKSILENEDIHFKLGAECIAFDKRDNKIIVKTKCDAPEIELACSHVLLAIGRTPNTSDLGLDKAGVTVDSRGFIQVDEELRTNIKHIWALGECNGRGAFTHTAYNDYEIVADNLIEHQARKVSDRILTYALYTDPPLGRAGLTESEVRKSGIPALIAKRNMTQIKRAVMEEETQGFIKILVDAKSNQILGAAVLGLKGDEVIQSILDFMYTKSPYTVLKNAVNIHPTVTELIPTILSDLKPLE